MIEDFLGNFQLHGPKKPSPEWPVLNRRVVSFHVGQNPLAYVLVIPGQTIKISSAHWQLSGHGLNFGLNFGLNSEFGLNLVWILVWFFWLVFYKNPISIGFERSEWSEFVLNLVWILVWIWSEFWSEFGLNLVWIWPEFGLNFCLNLVWISLTWVSKPRVASYLDQSRCSLLYLF